MREAYSRLLFLLEQRGLTRAELQRRLAEQDEVTNPRMLARLMDPDRPLERVNLRVVGAVCRVLGIGLGDLIVFAEIHTPLVQTLPEMEQRRLDELMERHGEGELSSEELEALDALVAKAESLARSNAQRLAEHRRWLEDSGPTPREAAFA